MKKHENKTRLTIFLIFFAITAFALPALPHAFAQDYTDITANLTVDAGQSAELTLEGCWKDTGGGVWDLVSGGLSLLQPGDRENGGSNADFFGIYDVFGGNPNGNILPTDGNAFAYGDCQFQVNIQGYSEYDITFHSDAFNIDSNPTVEIPDMIASDQATFDYNLDNEDQTNPYDPIEGEHGFFIVASDISPSLLDDGTAAGTAYNTDKAYTALTCGTGGTHPCYHMIPNDTSPQYMFNETAGLTLTDANFVIRTGLGVDMTIPSGDYTMTVTVTLATSP